jgi:hypothetical protein
MPPVLDIALLELTGRAKQLLLAREVRLGAGECHHVLQLIAETVGSSGLVVSACKSIFPVLSLDRFCSRTLPVKGWVVRGCL